MALRDLALDDAYDTDSSSSSPLESFYLPALAASMSYDRLAGFFSSRALAVAARGIAGLIKNGGCMRLVCSPYLSDADRTVLESAATSGKDAGESEGTVGRIMAEQLDGSDIESKLVNDSLEALGWMLREGFLEIKVVVARSPLGHMMSGEEAERAGLFHMKVGILSDSAGDSVSFSGSINESQRAWLENIEEFKVFKSWAEPLRVAEDHSKFIRYWSGHSARMRTMTLPMAVHERLLARAPKHMEDLGVLVPENEPSGNFDDRPRPIELWRHQEDALSHWLEAGRHGILAMATGAGKTVTAAACMQNVFEADSRLLAVIAVPQRHLATQWRDTLVKWFPPHAVMLAYSGVSGWRDRVAKAASELAIGLSDLAVVITTHETATSPGLLEPLRRAAAGRATMLIGDEVHAQGACQARVGLDASYSYRLGLSATPIRAYDEEGSDVLLDYFGGVVYEFDIEQGLSTEDPRTGQSILAPYLYHLRFVHMTQDELEEYLRKTKAVAARLSGTQSDQERWESLRALAAARAAVTKKASQKLEALDALLGELGEGLRHCLVYCQDTEQLEAVREVVDARGLSHHQFTGDESSAPEAAYAGLSKREWIMRSFTRGDTAVLLAMKCLDEGVDVPEARIGIMLASSQSEREFVQRRGRLLRRSPGKMHADIYDVLVAPSGDYEFDPPLGKAENTIYKKEVERARHFADLALNRAECYAKLIEHGL